MAIKNILGLPVLKILPQIVWLLYAYNGDFQLVSATSVSGGTETYEYDKKGKLCKITNCYDEVTDQISYLEHGQVDCLTNASGLKQVYTYNKLQKQTGLKRV